MGSRNSVHAHTNRAKAAAKVEDKLNALADAIYELADFVDDLENQLKGIEHKIR